MKKGWLYVNEFLTSSKFNEIYDLLETAFKKNGISLKLMNWSKVEASLIDNSLNTDFCLFWDKDLYMAELLEKRGIKLFNSKRAIELCDNKALTYLNLLGKVRMPKTIISPKTFENIGYKEYDFIDIIERELAYPFIVKEVYGSFGKQVYLVKNREELLKLIDSFGYKDFICQEWIKENVGKDIRVNVLGNKVVCAMERINENDYRSNITNGGHSKRIEISKEVEEIAINASMMLGLDFSGVDVLIGKDGPYICEVNSNPHFKSIYECTQINFAEKISDYVMERI